MCGAWCRRMLFIVSATQGPSGARVEDTVKDFWATRPRRPRRGRKIAGVASGIANRYRIDPVLVRVGFAVAAIYGGAGVLIYLLGWLFLPEQDDEVSPIESLFGKGRSSTSSGFTLLLGIATVPVLGWFFSGAFTGSFSSWTSLLVVGGLLFMLHQSRGNLTPVNPGATESAAPPPQPTMPIYPPPIYPPQPVYPPVYPPQPAATMPFTPPTSPPADVPPPATPEPRTTPPAWDPLGAAPFAWDLPEPSTPEPEEPEPPAKRRKPRVATATLGIALMAIAGLAIAESTASVSWISPEHIVGVTLAIIGLGLVAGAILRSGRGLIALAVPLSVVGMGMTTISTNGYQGYGDMSVRPLSVGAVSSVYERSVGTVELDLTGLPDVGEVYTEVRTGIGSAEVVVPMYADVTVTCSAEIGTVDCLGRTADSIEATVDEFTSVGDSPGGLEITLYVSADTGNVEVRRG